MWVITMKVIASLRLKSFKYADMSFMDTHEDWIHEIKLTRLREQLKVGTDQVKINDTDPIDLWTLVAGRVASYLGHLQARVWLRWKHRFNGPIQFPFWELNPPPTAPPQSKP